MNRIGTVSIQVSPRAQRQPGLNYTPVVFGVQERTAAAAPSRLWGRALGVMLSLAGVAWGVNLAPASASAPVKMEAVTPETHVQEVTDQDFDKLVRQSERPVVVKFGAPWCGPCQQMAPELEALAKDYKDKLTVVHVNIDNKKSLKLAQEFGHRDKKGEYTNKLVPSTRFFKKATDDAQENTSVADEIGFRNKAQLTLWVEKHRPKD